MADASYTIKTAYETYPDRTLEDLQIVLQKLRERARAVQAKCIAPCVSAGFRPECAENEQYKEMAGIIRRIDTHYMPWVAAQIASDPSAAKTPGKGDLIWIWKNAGLQTDPDTGEKVFTPEIAAPDRAENVCDAKKSGVRDAWISLPIDVLKQAADVATKIPEKLTKVGTNFVLPAALALGALAIFSRK